ncbi:MAG TPA: protease pro-enzyme activation domain-containing protein [Candidatus Baltobacteraceae bacterium]|nr:protease pro-enzyme activation domain-containing protein [Candidatus Baltobacteraceae bacterium]
MIRSSIRVLGALLAGAMLITACGGGGGVPKTASLVAPPAQNTGPIPANTANFAWGAPLLKQLSYAGPATTGGLTVQVLVDMQNAQGLLQYAAQASNPRSGVYRQWLTPQEIGSEYGATAANYAAVANYFASYGLHVGGWPQRETLEVTGSLAAFTKALGTAFGVYTFEGKQIVAPTGTPHFTTALPVSAVFGLVGEQPAHTYIIHNNNAAYYGYSPQQIATGFDYSGAASGGLNGSGIDIGIIGTGPILDANGHDDDTAALASFWNAKLASVVQVDAQNQPATTQNGNTGTGSVDPTESGSYLTSPPPVTNPSCNYTGNPNEGLNNYAACNPEDYEAQLDTESVASLAPGATVLFYLGFDSYCIYASGADAGDLYAPPCAAGDTPQQYEGIQIADDEIQQAIADNKADALSLSFGAPENIEQYYGYIQGSATGGAPGVGQIEFASLAAEGIAVFVSSGDNGAWDCQDPTTGAYLGIACVSYPASDPNVVAVGGVNIPLDESGNLTGSITAWADNTTLGGNGTFGNNVGSGGGVSAVFTPQPWQAATTGAAMRELPDMSLDADPNTGPSVAVDAAYGFAPVAIGGTSASAPEAAAQWGIVLQACMASATCNKGGTTGYRLGDPAALYYAIYGTSALAAAPYKSSFTPALTYAQTFYDVIYGNNQAVPPNVTPTPASTPGGYSAGPGYDQVTGVGAPFTGHLVQAVTGTNVP